MELNPGLRLLLQDVPSDFKGDRKRRIMAIPVKDNETMKIGNKTLRFERADLHWPDTMYTYIEEEQI